MRTLALRKLGMGTSLVALMVLAVPAVAVALDWDQKAVTALADQFTRDVTQIQEGIAKEWEKADKQSVRYIVLDDLMTLQQRAVALQTHLRAGEGREPTLPIYRRVLALLGHARQDAATFPEVAAQKSRIDAARKTLSKLAAYYVPAPKLLPPLPPPVQEPEPEESSSPPGDPAASGTPPSDVGR